MIDNDVPARVALADEDAFVASDVAAFVRDLEKPLYNYRMARGQLSRLGYPKRLREYEAKLRSLRHARFRLEVVTGDDGEVVHRDTITVQDGDTLTITLGNVRRIVEVRNHTKDESL